jgi:chemotaxis protein MotB
MPDDQPQEIIIVRRRVDGEEAHHGGAWKIAYADFVTAMMAFFLVLWILNSTNKDSQTIIARYFNPVKMEDFAKNKKGIRESQKEEKPGAYDGEIDKTPPPGPQQGKIEEKGKDPNKDIKAKSLMNEETLFENPYAALDQIAGKVKDRDKPQEAQARDAEAKDGQAGGSARADDAGAGGSPDEGGSIDGYRDPFRSASANGDGAAAAEREKAQPQAPPPVSSAREKAASLPGKGAAEAAEQAESVRAAELKKDIAQAAKAEAAQAAKGKSDASAGAPGLDVQATSEGLLISLTDSESFGMFDIGSSSPNPRLVRLMDRIAQSLKTQPGAIVLRGHTDARRYRGGTSDNWRLSASRAQMALYMLVRGGLPEARVEKVEGYADRRLKIAEKPEAAENRRIEILLRKAAP